MDEEEEGLSCHNDSPGCGEISCCGVLVVAGCGVFWWGEGLFMNVTEPSVFSAAR